MSNTETMILYDIPNAKMAPWSPNTWKARYALNFKGLPYKTEWVEGPDIEPLCLKIGAAPTSKKPDGRPLYTLPVIYDPSTKRAVSESAAITKYLDETYPETPVLFPAGTDALQAVFLGTAWTTIGLPLLMNTVARTCDALGPRTSAHFRNTGEAGFQKPLEQLAGEEHWVALEGGLGKLDTWLKANGAGRDELFMGDRVCFCDLQLAGLLMWTRSVCGEDSADWERIAGWHGGKWKRIIEYFDKYAAVN
ncbi:hypothetical protein EIP86_010949 [Pleurotus ostreatoroseus]|nr:hypothetical protein EIP86_010949 [Pleurotus ostreatoroseus]